MYIFNVICSTFEILKIESLFKYFALQCFYLVSALIQILGVASIAPFIGILSNPNIIHSNEYLSYIYTEFNLTNDTGFIVGFAGLTMGLIILANIISGVTLWLTFKFSVTIGAKVQYHLYKNLLYRGYIFHKSNNYNDSIALISQEAPRFVYLVLQPFLLLTSHIFIAFVILFGLLFVDPVIAISSGLMIGLSYLATYIFLRKFLNRHGKVVTRRNKDVQSILSDSFNGIKEIQLRTLERNFLNDFEAINRTGLISTSLIALAGDIPKLVIESISFSAILLLAIFLLMNNSGSEHVVGILSLYAVAGYKLLPSMQQIYKSITNLSAHGVAATRVLNELKTPTENQESIHMKEIKKIYRLRLHNISFSYDSGITKVINNLSADFKLGTLNTIVGPSGSGKSTLIDIILGLLHYQKGTVSVDDNILSKKDHAAFKDNVSYVPQHIYISNGNVISNVAFGVNDDDIDYDRLHKALDYANATEFINKLPDGIKSFLGHNGQLLSGGQRQRIGIARALYHETSLLVLDEPTSALDIESEHEIMRILHELKNKVLIVIVSHRPAAIQMSDNISLMKEGEIIEQGSFDQLMKCSENFRLLIKKSKTGDTNKHI